MGVLEEFALGFRGGASSAATTKYTEQERLAVLEQITRLETGLSQAMSNNDKAALSYYESQVKAQQENRKLTAQLVRDAMRADGTMNVEALKARAADLRNIRDNTSRMLAAYGRRGLSEYQQAVNQFAGQLRPGASGTAGRTAVIEYLNSTLDPSDPATYEALRTAYSAFGMTVPPEGLKGAGAWNDAQAALKTVGRFTEKPPTNAAEAQELKAALENIGNTGTPSFEASRAAVGEGSVPEIRDRIAKLEGQLSSTAVQGLQPPTMAQLESAAKRSGYRKWAEARGFTIGTVGDNGQYEPGPDDQRAYWRAWREANGRMTFGRDKMGAEQSLVVMPSGENNNGAAVKAASKYKMVPIANAEGSTLVETLVETPAGDLYSVTGDSSTLIRTRDGEWTSPQAKIDYEWKLPELQTWSMDGKPLTLSTVSGMFDPANQEKLAPMGDTEEPSAVTRVNGRVLNPHLSDDPNNTIRMAVTGDNGVVYEVKYTRENADMPWVEQERKESKRYAGTLKPALPDGSPIPEPVKLRQHGPRPDRTVTASDPDGAWNEIPRVPEHKRKNNPRDLTEPFNGRTEAVGEDLHSDPNAADGSGTNPNETFPNGEGVGGKRTKVPETARERDNRRRHTGVGPDGKDMKMNMEGPSAPPVFDPNQPIDPSADIREGLESMPEDALLTRAMEPITRQRVVPTMNPLPTGYNPDEPRRPLSRPINGINPEIPAAGQGDVLSQTGDITVDMERGPLVTGYDRKLDQTRAELGIMEADRKMDADNKAKKAREDAAAAMEAARVSEVKRERASVDGTTNAPVEKQMQKPQESPGFWKSLVNRFRKSTTYPGVDG